MARSAIVLSLAVMEEATLVAADCVVICSCCPCLILQLVVLLLIRLPCKLAKRSKRLVLRKLRKRPRKRKGKMEVAAELIIIGEDPTLPGGVRMEVADAVLGCRGCAISEAERVLERLYEEGELGFGSFWRRGGGGEPLAERLVLRGGGSNVQLVEVLYI